MSTASRADTVAELMAGFRKGEEGSASRLMEVLYPELRRLAASKMRGERAGHSWQPTLLVNELYLELVKRKALGGESGGASGGKDERAQFLALAGFLMHRLLILHSRPLRQRTRREDIAELEHLPAREPESEVLQAVEDALSRLERVDPKMRTVVEMRVFEGMTSEEIAAQLGCSARSVGTYWSFARRWLETHLTV
jgi:RNA polymerase sigma factor (TIGR02999 family)